MNPRIENCPIAKKGTYKCTNRLFANEQVDSASNQLKRYKKTEAKVAIRQRTTLVTSVQKIFFLYFNNYMMKMEMLISTCTAFV